MSARVINGPSVLIIFSILTMIIIVTSTDADEVNNLIEGDISGFAPNFLQFEAGTATVLKAFLWPKNKVPSQKLKQLFAEAIQDIQSKTCIRFIRHTKQKDYIEVIQGTDCSSKIGRTNQGRQDVSLPLKCGTKAIFIHELLHAIGFPHEQSRQDRDQFVKINWQNIETKKEHNFARYVVRTSGPYDYNSLMHYKKNDFSKNGRDTITPFKRNVNIGQRVGMSPVDIAEVNKLYCGKGKGK